MVRRTRDIQKKIWLTPQEVRTIARIGDQVLAPAPSDYRRTVLYNSFDVTKQVAGGNADNAIGVTLGNGRFYTMRQNSNQLADPKLGSHTPSLLPAKVPLT